MKKIAFISTQFVSIFICSAGVVLAQDNTSVTNEKTVDASPLTPLSDQDFQSGLFVLGFGFLVILAQMWLISKKNFESEIATRLIVITLVITGLLYLTRLSIAGNDYSPAIGLLGTIIGYLLGKYQTQTTTVQDNEK
jgi:uncharacterized membrane protein YfcA